MQVALAAERKRYAECVSEYEKLKDQFEELKSEYENLQALKDAIDSRLKATQTQIRESKREMLKEMVGFSRPQKRSPNRSTNKYKKVTFGETEVREIGREGKGNKVTSKISTWQQFLKEMAGSGYTIKQLSDQYKNLEV